MKIPATATSEQIIKLKEANPDLNYSEIGRIVGVSREWVRQVIQGKYKSTKKPPPQVDFMLKPSDVARLLHVHVNTVRRWSNQGKLKAYRLGPRRDRRFWQEDIDAFLEEGKR